MSIEPAMSAEEWKEWTENMSWYLDQGATRAEGIEVLAPSLGGLHQLAAKCLHGQPFGFAREDVVRLRVGAYDVPDGWSGNPWMEELATRIEALLPPE